MKKQTRARESDRERQREARPKIDNKTRENGDIVCARRIKMRCHRYILFKIVFEKLARNDGGEKKKTDTHVHVLT